MGGVTEPLSVLINGGLWNGWCGQGCLRVNVSDHRPQVYQWARKYRTCFSLKKESGITTKHIFQRLRYLSSSYGGISHNPNSQTWPAMTFSHLQMHAHTLWHPIGWQMCPISILPHKKHLAFIILSPEDVFPPSHFIPLSYPSIKRTAVRQKTHGLLHANEQLHKRLPPLSTVCYINPCILMIYAARESVT